MGNFVSNNKLSRSFFGYFFGREYSILMIGLNNAGKTCLLYRLKQDIFIDSQPTIGFNSEKIKYKNIFLEICDVGGQYKIRPLWKQYINTCNADALVFVIDSMDKDRMEEVKNELHNFINESQKPFPVLILANKQDSEFSLASKSIAEIIGCKKIKNRKWFLQGCSAKTGEGLTNGMNWLSRVLQEDDSGIY